jgi:RES domain-containing protein
MCYRAHDPRWSFKPLSGDGAALYGGRFNPKGIPTLYLGLTIVTAIKEANQGFPRKIDPCVLCMYEVDCADIADLRTADGQAEHGATRADMACAWFWLSRENREPSSWRLALRLKAGGCAGILVPSFVRNVAPEDNNLVLWLWSNHLPHRVSVFDPSNRLPKNQLSWD